MPRAGGGGRGGGEGGESGAAEEAGVGSPPTKAQHRDRPQPPGALWTVPVRSPTIGCPMERAPIVFGTDGWRCRIARDLTFDSVRRVVTAAAAWTIDETNLEPGDPWTLPVVFDTRFLSPELAAESAAFLASHGFRVLLSDRPVPTPCASWHVASRGLRAGLAITAAHNPPLWNGVKVKSS